MTTSGEMPTGTRTMKASEFKAKCLKLMDEVAESGEEIIITKNGKPVAKLAPYPESTEAMCAGVDTRVDGQGRGNRPGQDPIDGDEGGVK